MALELGKGETNAELVKTSVERPSAVWVETPGLTHSLLAGGPSGSFRVGLGLCPQGTARSWDLGPEEMFQKPVGHLTASHVGSPNAQSPQRRPGPTLCLAWCWVPGA